MHRPNSSHVAASYFQEEPRYRVHNALKLKTRGNGRSPGDAIMKVTVPENVFFTFSKLRRC